MGFLKCGGCLFIKPPTVTKLSQLEIDADKDWQGKGITNLKELAAPMQKGDMMVRGDSGIIIITPGNPGSRLTSQGAGSLPIWKV